MKPADQPRNPVSLLLYFKDGTTKAEAKDAVNHLSRSLTEGGKASVSKKIVQGRRAELEMHIRHNDRSSFLSAAKDAAKEIKVHKPQVLLASPDWNGGPKTITEYEIQFLSHAPGVDRAYNHLSSINLDWQDDDESKGAILFFVEKEEELIGVTFDAQAKLLYMDFLRHEMSDILEILEDHQEIKVQWKTQEDRTWATLSSPKVKPGL